MSKSYPQNVTFFSGRVFPEEPGRDEVSSNPVNGVAIERGICGHRGRHAQREDTGKR